MTRSAIRSLARQFARVTASGVSDTDTNTLIDEAYAQTCKDISGAPKRGHIQIGPKFYIGTDFRFRMTIAGTGDTLTATDLQVSATELTEATGATVATALQTAIRTATGGTGTTVSWNSTTGFYFTIVTTGATSQTIESPSGITYSDAFPILFGGADETQATSTTWTGDFPQDVTIEGDLPSDFHTMMRCSWDGMQLDPAPRDYFVNPQCTGTPMYYDIRNDHIYLYPTPTEQGRFYIEYNAVPTTALAGDTYAPILLPDRYHILVAYYTAYLLLLGNHEFKQAAVWFGQYTREKNKYIVNRHSQNTGERPVSRLPVWYKVKV